MARNRDGVRQSPSWPARRLGQSARVNTVLLTLAAFTKCGLKAAAEQQCGDSATSCPRPAPREPRRDCVQAVGLKTGARRDSA